MRKNPEVEKATSYHMLASYILCLVVVGVRRNVTAFPLALLVGRNCLSIINRDLSCDFVSFDCSQTVGFQAVSSTVLI